MLGQMSVDPSAIELVIHGTTLATNAIIERRGAKTCLLTTKGHRDVLAMAFENRFEQYDINIERPEPLIPRVLRIPVDERIGAGGLVAKPLDHDSVERAIEQIREQQVHSVAIGFLHSYANSEHERIVADLVKQALPDIDICASSEVCPEIREYERFSTTAANAYVLPLMRAYLERMANRLEQLGITCPLRMITSNGGLTTLETASRFPIRLVESGPAGGVILAAAKAKALGVDQVVSFDMGGTTAKICLIDGGQPLHSRSFEVDRRYRFKKGSGLPVRIPVIEMVEIGAGGGSIASLDSLNRTQVGPSSAGSQPGPACYGQGGKHATVTDGDTALGRLVADRFAGGQLELNVEAAQAAIEHTFPGRDVVHGAIAISEVVDENMAAATRSHASEWGLSAEQRTVIAYGGAAPLHSVRLMEKLNLAKVVVPVGAGVGSAKGFLLAPIGYEVVRSEYCKLSDLDIERLKKVVAEMHEEALGVVSEAAGGSTLESEIHAYMRYTGQGYEIAVPVDVDDLSAAQLRDRFHIEYEKLYHRLIPQDQIEILSWTLSLHTQESPVKPIVATTKRSFKTGGLPKQSLIFNDDEQEAQVADRELLKPGHLLKGPLLVTEPQTTTVVPKGYTLFVNSELDLEVSRSAPQD